jgi:hypothetical protein
LISGRPSSLSASRCPPWFERFIGTMPLSDSSATCMRAVWLSPSPAGLLSSCPTGVSEVFRFSCMQFLDVSGVFDYAGPTRDSRYRLRSCCLPPNSERRRPDCIFSELNTQPTYTPVYASPCTSRCPAQYSGPSGSLPLSRKALSTSTACQFIPAHEFPIWSSGSRMLMLLLP